MTYITYMFCEECKKPIEMKSTEKWVSLKCKCKCAIYYPNGHFTVIPKEVYIKNKQRKEEIKYGSKL